MLVLELHLIHVCLIYVFDKAKPAERRGRKATGPRFLSDASRDASKDPKTPGCRHTWTSSMKMRIRKENFWPIGVVVLLGLGYSQPWLVPSFMRSPERGARDDDNLVLLHTKEEHHATI